MQYCGLGEVTGNITVLPTWMHEPPAPGEIPPAGIERTDMQISIQHEDGNELPPWRARRHLCLRPNRVRRLLLQRGSEREGVPQRLVSHRAISATRAVTDTATLTATSPIPVGVRGCHGPVVRLDQRGMLYMTGSESDMHISGGSNIDPREVEEKILKHPDVAEVSVVGFPDEQWGEIGYAVCVPRADSALNPAPARGMVQIKHASI